MKKFFLLFPLAVVALVTSCTPKDGNDEVIEEVSKSVSFSPQIKGSTRATDLQFEEGDKISVFASTTGSISSENYAQNVCYGYEDNLFTTEGTLSYPSSNEDLTFFAVYPYGDYVTPEFSFTVMSDQRSHTNYTASDLMTATAVGENSKVVDLVFNHRLSKIVLNIYSDNMPVGEQTVVFKDVRSNVIANLSSNTYRVEEFEKADIYAASNGTNSFKVLLPPQAFAKDMLLAEIAVGEKVFSWILDRDLVLNSGVEYVFNLELKDNVVFVAQINPWGEPEQIESVIPEEYLGLLEPYIPIHTGTTPPNIEGTYFISPNALLTDNVGFEPGYVFADDYIMFYDQTSDNTINMKTTQLLGDLSVGEGLFISGSGENFTIYFNEHTTYDNGSWVIKATIISGEYEDGSIKNYTCAFLILDEYDTDDSLMDVGQYRVLIDQNYISESTVWPLETRSGVRAAGKLKTAK